MKLLQQNRLPKPEGREESEWTLDFRYDSETEDEPRDRDRCDAKAQHDKWRRANDMLRAAGNELCELLGPFPPDPDPKRF